MKKPKILGPLESHDFHDSLLKTLEISPGLDSIRVTLEVPDENHQWSDWTVHMAGVLQFEYETTGNGYSFEPPIQIYDVYRLEISHDIRRWKSRIHCLDKTSKPKIHHILFASSHLCTWDKSKDLEGISVVCREFSVVRP